MAIKQRAKKRKKIWVKIFAPQIFDNKQIGESSVNDVEDIKNRVVEVYLFNLTMNPKHQEAKLILKINELRGEEAYTKVIGYELINAYLKRIVKKKTDRVDVSEIFITKDKEVIRLKPIIITAANTTYSVRKSIRNRVIETLNSKISNSTYEGIIKELISGKLEKDLYDEVSNILPLRTVKIRKMELIEGVEKEKTLRMYEILYGKKEEVKVEQ